jgi:DNA polymerase III gamma/tau subunit
MSWGIIGHEWAVEQLRGTIAAGSDAHAYLISGTAGLGKSLLALRLAQALNCEVSPAWPVGSASASSAAATPTCAWWAWPRRAPG